jgi:pimeloyl-ACP methyl ester carboxylesterase
MEFLKRDGVRLAFEDSNTNLPPMILVHGLGCNHEFLSQQAEYFSRSHRVVSVDLRGHGESDAPKQDYTMTVFAEDLKWLCKQPGLVKPVLIGHSMGGNIALQFAGLCPDIPASIVLIDSVLFPAQLSLDSLQPLAEALQGPDYLTALRQALSSLCLLTDRKTKEMIAAVRAPQHVLASAMPNHVMKYDSAAAAAGCRVPVAYIGAATPLADLSSFQNLTPQLVVTRTLGSGHFSPAEAPEQINAMLSRFLAKEPPPTLQPQDEPRAWRKGHLDKATV